jgi:hypothetical protein
VRSASSSSSSFEEIEVAPPAPAPAPPPQIGKKGKTRMPKRLAHKKAVAELGIPFEEEDDFLIIQRALAKENIDEIIEKSKIYKEGTLDCSLPDATLLTLPQRKQFINTKAAKK